MRQKTTPPAWLLGAVLATLAGCTQVPDLGNHVQPDLRKSDYPTLIPIDAALARQSPKETQNAQQLENNLSGRLYNLRRKARALQEPVVDGDTRTRMQTGVTGKPALE